MKTLIELNQEITEYRSELIKLAATIHPLLISTLNKDNYTLTSLYDNGLVLKFKEFSNEVRKVNSIIWNEALKYYVSIMKDFNLHDINVGYYTDGTELYVSSTNFKLNYVKYEPSFEIESVYRLLTDYNDCIEFSPFWAKSTDIWNENTGRYISVKPMQNPELYINSINSLINTNELSTNDIFIIAARTEAASQYKMITEIKKAGSISSTTAVKEYIEMVIEHKILEELLKHEPNKEYYSDIEYNHTINIHISEVNKYAV